jgi:copper chaperone NosL
MVISDPRYGAEVVTATGKVLTFDSIECLASYYVQVRASGAAVRSAWVTDFAHPGTLVPAEGARYVRTDGGADGPGSPMGKGLTAFAADADSATLHGASGGAPALGWNEVLALVQGEGMERGIAAPAPEAAHAR